MSAERYRSVVIAMAIMWVMQPSVHEVIDVITVRHLFVSAARTMRVRAPGLGRAARGVGIANLDNMFVDMISMHVMQMTVVQIIDMPFMANRRMPAVGAMLVGMIGMMLLGAGRHDGGSFLPRSEMGPGVYELGPTERSARFRSFLRKRESRPKSWVPAFAGTNGRC